MKNQNIVDDKVTNQKKDKRPKNFFQGVYTVPTVDNRRHSNDSNNMHPNQGWENGYAGNMYPQTLTIRRSKEINDDTFFSPSDNKQDSSSTSGISSDAYYHLDDNNIFGTPSVYI